MHHDLEQLSQSRILFTLDNRNNPVRCLSRDAWIEWMLNNGLEHVLTFLSNNRELLTTFMGYCGEHRESQPLTFATLLKPEPLLPEFNVPLQWYRTWNEAQAGHLLHVRRFTLKTVHQPNLQRQ